MCQTCMLYHKWHDDARYYPSVISSVKEQGMHTWNQWIINIEKWCYDVAKVSWHLLSIVRENFRDEMCKLRWLNNVDQSENYILSAFQTKQELMLNSCCLGQMWFIPCDIPFTVAHAQKKTGHTMATSWAKYTSGI